MATRKQKTKSKCPVCGQVKEKILMTYWEEKYYCPECYKVAKKNKDERTKLLNYICQRFDWDAPKPLVLSQVKKYHEEYGYTYGGMLYTLKYLFEILQDPDLFPTEEDGIFKVSKFYDEAKEYLLLLRANRATLQNQPPPKNGTQIIIVDQEKRDEYYTYLKHFSNPDEDDIPINELLTEEEKLCYLSQEELDNLEHKGGDNV